jgi:hypothetical protein
VISCYDKCSRGCNCGCVIAKIYRKENGTGYDKETAAAAVSLKETRISLVEFKLTGKAKVWQISYIQKYRDNYCEENHEISSDRKMFSQK